MTNIAIHPAFEQIPGAAGQPLLLLCDHASNHVPPEYHRLGLPHAEFERHIAYDLGARDLTLGLAARLGAPALLTCHSRLLIDPNRGLDDPTMIMKLSDGAVIPGNAVIDSDERHRRVSRYYSPYHAAITAALDAMLAQGLTPAIISVHSFTPFWKGVERPWHVGLLWDRDARLVEPMLAMLRAMPGLTVGDNEPYHGALEGDTLSRHGTARGIAHVLIEVRQDLLAGKSGVDDWVERLAPVIEAAMRRMP